MSRPFDKPGSGKIAVKVINHFGDEMLKVFDVMKAAEFVSAPEDLHKISVLAGHEKLAKALRAKGPEAQEYFKNGKQEINKARKAWGLPLMRADGTF